MVQLKENKLYVVNYISQFTNESQIYGIFDTREKAQKVFEDALNLDLSNIENYCLSEDINFDEYEKQIYEDEYYEGLGDCYFSVFIQEIEINFDYLNYKPFEEVKNEP